MGKLFRGYVWADKDIGLILWKLKHEDYGKDFKWTLFQFYVNPIPIQIQNLGAKEPYHKKENSMAIPIIIKSHNFFSKSEDEHYSFLRQPILQKLDLLADVLGEKKLDTKMEFLKSDLEKVLL